MSQLELPISGPSKKTLKVRVPAGLYSQLVDQAAGKNVLLDEFTGNTLALGFKDFDDRLWNESSVDLMALMTSELHDFSRSSFGPPAPLLLFIEPRLHVILRLAAQ